jgi:hypothetical protein
MKEGWVIDASWGPVRVITGSWGRARELVKFVPGVEVDSRHWEDRPGDPVYAEASPGPLLGVYHPDGEQAAERWIDENAALVGRIMLRAAGF